METPDSKDCIRYPKEDNPFYPLPPDYPRLAPDAQREARLNAVCLQETPEDLVHAWCALRNLYFRPTPPGFFYKRWKESPPFHYQIIHDLGAYPCNVLGAPRGGAKTTVLLVEVPIFLSLTRKNFAILLLVSKDQVCTKVMGTRISPQFRNNQFILGDFGKQKGYKGEHTWSNHMIQLPNGSTIECQSVGGAVQGPRPDLIIVDDVEADPQLQSDETKYNPELTGRWEGFLTSTVLPMLDEGESTIYQIGTPYNAQTFIYHMLTTREDERFLQWNRRMLDAEDDGHGNLLWPTKWTRERLDRERTLWGASAYNANRRCMPGVGDDPLLPLDPHLNLYTVENPDNALVDAPLNSNALLCSWIKGPDGFLPLHRPFGSTVRSMYRVLVYDHAKCLSASSDFRAFHVIGLEDSDCYQDVWWSLDLLLLRRSGDCWLPLLFEMAKRWEVPRIGVESMGAQEELAGQARAFVEARSNWGFRPYVVPIKYPKQSFTKEDRIAALGSRFRVGGFRIPGHRRKTEGAHAVWTMGAHRTPYAELFHEIERFTGKPGGTKYDDALDTAAMAPYLLRGRSASGVGPNERREPDMDALSRLRRGELEDETGEPLVNSLTPGELSLNLAQAVGRLRPSPSPRRRPAITVIRT